MAEPDASKSEKLKLGLQKDGSVVVAPDDYCLQFFESIDWNKPVTRSVCDVPWITPEEMSSSMTEKYLNYKLEDNYADPENPLLVGAAIPDLRAKERNKKRKKKESQLNVVAGGLKEIGKDDSSSSESDDFIDEYGNIRSDASSDAETVEPKKEKVAKEKEETPSRPAQRPVSEPSVETAPEFQDSEAKFSVLNCREQQSFLSLLRKYRFQIPGSDVSQNPEWKALQLYQEMVHNERREFQEHARTVFIPRWRQFFTSIDPETKRFVDAYYCWRLRRINRLPRLYNPVAKLNGSMLRLVPFSTEQSGLPQFEMRLERNILEMGLIPKLTIPNGGCIRSGRLNISTNVEKLCARFPCKDSDTNAMQNFAKLGVSADLNAEKLAGIYLPDIVISSSGLKSIFANFMPQLEEVWTIPFTVRQHGKSPVIYIDKPLPPKSMSVEEKLNVHCKFGAKLLLIHPWYHPKDKKQTKPTVDKTPVPPSNIFDENIDLSLLETFGTSSISQLDGLNSDELSSSDEDGKMVIVEESDTDPAKSSHAMVTRRMTRSQTTSESSSAPGKGAAEKTVTTTKRISQDRSRTPTKSQGTAKKSSRRRSNFILTSSSDSDGPPDEQPIMVGEPKKLTGLKVSIFDSDPETGDSPSKPEIRQSSLTKETLANALDTDLPITSSSSVAEKATEVTDANLSINSPSPVSVTAAIRNTISPEKRKESTSDKTSSVPTTPSAASVSTIPRGSAAINQQRSFLDDIMNSQTTIFVSKPQKPDSKNIPDVRLYTGESLMNFDTGLNSDDFEQPNSGKNVSFRMWALRPKSGSRKDIRVLVRSKMHAVHVDYKHRGPQSNQPFTISQKIERQPDFGAEILSRKELAQDWISTMIRPASSLLRLRVAPVNKKVLAYERLTLKQLTDAGRSGNFRPAEALGNLHTLFEQLIAAQLKPGSYLMDHNANTGAFVRILESVSMTEKSANSCDLHALYSVTRPEEERSVTSPPTWRPIDLNVIVGSNVPGLFPPRPWNPPKHGQQKQSGKKKKKKK